MDNKNWQSLSWLHRLYRRSVLHRLTGLIFMLLVGGIASIQLLLLLSATLNLHSRSINVLFSILGLMLTWMFVRYFRNWYGEGIRIASFFNQWERNHPDTQNRASLLVYAEKNAGEIARLGYSSELLCADDAWLNQYVAARVPRNNRIFLYIFLSFIVASAGLLTLQYNQGCFAGWDRIARALWVLPQETVHDSLEVPASFSIARGEPATLKARWAHPDAAKEPAIYIRSRTGWSRQAVLLRGKELQFRVPAVNREMEYYFSAGDAVSNKGRVVPLDPPSLTQGTIQVRPPDYTGLPIQTIERLRPVTVPEGSQLSIAAEASTALASADMVFENQTFPVVIRDNTLSSAMKLERSGDLFVVMKDEHGLEGHSPKYRMTAVPDATPTLEVLQPQLISNMPDDMQVRVQVHAQDDYRVERLLKHVQINKEDNIVFTMQVWSNTPQYASATTQSVTNNLFVTYDWNLAEYKLFPGDQISFTLEAFDNDALHGPKSVRSQTYVVKYPSLVDLLSQLDETEDAQTRDLNNLLDEQKKVTEDAQKTIDKITEKMENREPSSTGDPDNQKSTWMEEKELKDLKERHQELAEEAKKIENQLQQYQEQAQKTLDENPQETPKGFSPEMLEKVDKIRSLMNQLLDKDSQELVQKIDQTVSQLSQQISDDQLNDLKFSFEDYQQQLDRTLSMLQNTFQSRQMEGVRQMAEELAQRQEHLQRETEKLEKEQQAQNPSGDPKDPEAKQQELSNQSKLLQDRQQQIEDDVKTLMNSISDLQKSLAETNPDLAKKLEAMQQEAQDKGLQAELNSASQQMQQGNLQEAQKHQQNAQSQLQAMAQQMKDSMPNMGGMDLQQATLALSRLIQEGLFLSEQMESLTESPLGRSENLDALRRAQAFQRELERVQITWSEAAKTNPFMNRQVEAALRGSSDRLRQAIDAGRGEKWVGLHETRASMIALNDGIAQMMQDMQTMQQQMSQSQGQGMQQQMQQLISQQQGLQQLLQQLRQMQQQGGASEQLRQIAEQQAKVRKEIEKMMRGFRHAEQLRNQLQGIYQEMKEAEKLMQEGVNDEKMEETQKRIITRMLDAGTMKETDEYGKDREAVAAKSGLDPEQPPAMEPVSLPDKINQFVQRPPEETIPLPYRQALKNYYIRLAEQVTTQ